MEIHQALKSQYHASLKTLLKAIEMCPDAMWNQTADNTVPFWRVAYHALFYAHFYLQQKKEDFVSWAKHRDEAQYFADTTTEGQPAPKFCEPYTRDDLLEYWKICDGMIDTGVDALDLSAAQCGFPWYKMSTLEHQLVNIRHIQHHAAILATRLRRGAGISIPWVARG